MESTKPPAPPAPKPPQGRPAGRRPDPRRNQAIYDLLRNTGVEQVISLFNLGVGTKGGPGWTKYKVGNGLHMNIRHDTGGFKVLEGIPIPPLTGRDGAAKAGGKGAIDLTIALLYFEGTCPASPKEARHTAIQRLQESFHPHTLAAGYKPGADWKPKPKVAPAPPAKPVACELPAYCEKHRGTMERYLVETRGLNKRMVSHLIDTGLAFPSEKDFNYTDTRFRLLSLPDSETGRARMAALVKESARIQTAFRPLPQPLGGKRLLAEVGAMGDPKIVRSAPQGPLPPDLWAIAPELGELILNWQTEDAQNPELAAPVEIARKRLHGQAVTMVFPYIHVTENFATGYEHKDIPRDFKSKTLGISEGPKPESVFMLGCLNAKTKKLVMTEAPIDAISKWILDRPGHDTCIVATIGARPIPLLMDRAKQLGATVHSAFDCDETGTRVARECAKYCKSIGVPHVSDFPRHSEAVVSIPNLKGVGEKRLKELLEHCQKQGLPSKQDPAENRDLLRVCVGNQPEIWEFFRNWKDADQLDLCDQKHTAEERARLKAAPKFEVEVRYNKDWNDMLKGTAVPVLKWTAPGIAPTNPPALATPVGGDKPKDVEV